MKTRKLKFKKELKNLIIKNGYWSKSVFQFNNSAQKKIGYSCWSKWHNEVKMEIRY